MLDRLAGRFGRYRRCAPLCGEALDQLHDHFGVGVRVEVDAFAVEFFAQFEVIFDDAVVDDDEFAVHAEVRVRVALGGRAVRCPARMPDADAAGDRVSQQFSRRLRELADVAPQCDLTILDDRDTGRVVAAIFQPLQTVNDERRGVAIANITNNATHG